MAEQVLTIVRDKHGNFANYLKTKEIPYAPNKKNNPVEYAKLEIKMKVIVARRLSIEYTSPNVWRNWTHLVLLVRRL